VLHGRVVTLQLEVGQARQCVQFTLGPGGEFAFEHRQSVFVFTSFQGSQRLVGRHTELLEWQKLDIEKLLASGGKGEMNPEFTNANPESS
jgi:hypothetical protein